MQNPLIFAAALCVMAATRVALAQTTSTDITDPKSQITNSSAAPFTHPGILQSRDDLERMKKNVKDGVEPWASAWQAFSGARNRWIRKTYAPRPLEVVGRGVGATGQDNISNDCTAAYYNALAWYITDDEDYAKKSIEIMNAWSYKCKLINGKDAVLCAGIYGYKLMSAAEIMRHVYKKWPEKDVAQFQTLARDVFYPVVKDFSTFANGNWDGAAMASMIATGVFLDDRAMFDRAARYYMDGSGDGCVLHYVINETGQLQETGRDQSHAQLGIGLLSCVAEIAWKQGVDLYGAYDNRLLKGFEYTVKYNLGEEVPFQPTSDRTGKYIHQVASARGTPSVQIYEMVYNHYVNRAGMAAPYTARAAALRRPETLAVDQVGGGTLLFTLPAAAASAVSAAPATPGPIIAKGSEKGVTLLWPAAVHAATYTLRRAASPSGPFTVVAGDIKAVSFTDTTAKPNQLYYYTVAGANAAGTGAPTLPAGASAGLPTPWTRQDLGTPDVTGDTLFDGTTFTLEAAGADFAGKADQGHFAAMPLSGNGTIVARYVPQTPSQFARIGLMMRASAAADAPFVSVVITPQATQDIEVPNWHVDLRRRGAVGADASILVTSPNLDTPRVTWGRLMAPLWLKLERGGAGGSTFTAAYSADGQTWTGVGTTTLALPKDLLGGMCAASHIKGSTTVMFDHVVARQTP